MVKALYTLIAILLCATPQKIDAQAVSTQDSLALVDLYNSTNGANWVNKNNWLSGQVKDWNGITVLSGRVAAVVLDLNNLTGTLPNSLGDMSNIQIFEIGDNQIAGEIPSSMSNWSNLLSVDLDNNLFTGSFPEFLTGLTLLESIEIDNNQLSGSIPTSIGALTNLKNLDLDSNLFTGNLPSVIGNLTLLVTLDLSDNAFSGTIPSSFTNLLSLQELYLDDNQLTGSIPNGFSNLSTLVRFDLGGNMLSGNLPSDVGNYPSIKRLLWGNNQLTGTIPASISNNTFLTRIDLSNNNLSGSIPTSITNLTLLSRIYLANCGLSGSIPPEIGNMPSLKELDLRLNNLTGTIPTSLGNATKLDILFLDDNQLSGSIPSGLGNVLTLERLELDGNMLTGNIPPELGNLINLTELDIDNNQITGTIPSSLGGLAALTQLNLDNNQLTGAIPSSIFNIPGLRIVEIGFNMLDSFPDNLGGATELRRLLAESNNFSSVPNTLSNLVNLTRLRLDGNQLSDLPDLSGLAALRVLTLENNLLGFDDLSGNIVADSVNSYSPQADISAPATVDKNAGESWTNSATVAGSGNVYQWYLNGNAFSGATSNTLNISGLDASHAGTWVLHTTNPGVPGLTIKTSPTVLNVQGAANSPPVANNDEVETDANVAILVSVLDNDTDPNGDDITLDSISSSPSNGSAAIEGGDKIRYTPSAGFVGRDSLQYSISDASESGSAWVIIEVKSPVSIDEEIPEGEFWVGDNYPNPFGNKTNLEFNLPRTGHVTLQVFNLLGQDLGIHLDAQLTQGTHKKTLEMNLSSGSYIFVLSWEDQVVSKALTVQ